MDNSQQISSAGHSATPASSQLTPQGNFMSPPRKKERRNPSVTPRRFRRFFGSLFTADAQLGLQPQISRNRLALNDLPESNLNCQNASTPTKRKLFGEELLSSSPSLPEPEPVRKRSRLGAPAEHPFSDENVPALQHRIVGSSTSALENGLSSPTDLSSIAISQHEAEPMRPRTLSGFWRCSRSAIPLELSSKTSRPPSAAGMEVDEVEMEDAPPARPSEIRRHGGYDLRTRLLGREIGYSLRPGRIAVQYPAPDPHPDIAAYCSTSADVIQNTDFSGARPLIPFCVATTSRDGNIITAVGDEEGFVRFIVKRDDDIELRYWWRSHANAVMDVDWSPGGLHLATAAGDRSARVLDVVTQSTIVNLTDGHESCLRQVKFRPGDAAGGNILATSDRTSTIHIWDTRYRRPCSTIAEEVFVSSDGRVLSEATSTFGDAFNSLWTAHRRKQDDTPASVTSLQWLSPGHDYLLLSGSESDATIKLWDTRYIGYTRDGKPKPLSSTAQPADHTRRPHGITSLALNTDASRIYSVCKNGTVYAYATSHLILGHGPELANFETPKPRNGRQAQGLAPLYGFRHDRLKVNSFFIKCAVLPSTVLGTEILAVGSSDACPVLFPTDENAMQIEWQRQRDLSRDAESQHDNARMPHGSETALPSSQLSEARTDGPIPIYQKGAALIEGTTKEVSSVKWADDGTLVSISDDYSIRFWKHDAEKARFLRTCGYFGGHRHMAGWADIENSEELDDDDDPDN